MDMTTKLTGFKELAAGLRELPQNLARNVLRSAVSAGAEEVKVEAKKNAEAMRITGTLARSIYKKQIREASGPYKQTYYVGARQGKKQQKVGKKGVNRDAYYARFVEFGHFTRPSGGGRNLRKTNLGQANAATFEAQVRSGTVKWVPPQPFLRPAFDVKKDRAVQAMGERIAVGILSDAEKLRMRVGK